MPDRTYSSPYQMRENGVFRRKHQSEGDAEEAVAWCETCGKESRFVEEQVSAPYQEEGVEEPLDVYEIVEGRTMWRCVACEDLRTDPIAEEGYEWEDANDGYRVRNFPDEEKTWRAPGDEVNTR